MSLFADSCCAIKSDLERRRRNAGPSLQQQFTRDSRQNRLGRARMGRNAKAPPPVEAMPLHDAARNGDVEEMTRLLAVTPASINARDRHARTPYPAIRCWYWCCYLHFRYLVFCVIFGSSWLFFLQFLGL